MVNSTVNLSASITDPSNLDTLTCSINWDDGSMESGTLAAGVCTASHVYPAAGVYTIQMTGTDDDTGAKTENVMAVVYDPSSGFVTGGGWIDSPAGAYTLDPSLAGRAGFGFVSKYQKGATIPSGGTRFLFEAGSFYFESEAYDWLVISGARAQFKGTGAVNGVSGYNFLLTLTDGQVNGGGGVDKFRIKIWDATGIVYDNMIDYRKIWTAPIPRQSELAASSSIASKVSDGRWGGAVAGKPCPCLPISSSFLNITRVQSNG